MEYIHWLIGVSVAIALAERLWPARTRQPWLRRQLGNDVFYLLFNGHWYSVWFGPWVDQVASATNRTLESWSISLQPGLLHGAPFALQFLVYLLISDFLQWNVHRLLHRVPFLWQFHKLHHSVHEMDWAANFRFHWFEVVVYRSLLYLPLLWLGGDAAPLFAVAVFATAWGHFNHANLNVGLGALGYVFNSPRMHMWHHDASDEGGVAKNFGIVLSVWDWTFGTVFWPRDRAPARIGYPHDREMPNDLPRQLVFPLSRAGRN